MRIDPTSTLSGHPVLEIRELARRIGGDDVNPQVAAAILDVDLEESSRVLTELERQGYLEPSPTLVGLSHWRLTIKGSALAMASAAPPVKRSTAERHLGALLDRVTTVRDDDRFLYRVEKVVVFGSYLHGGEDRVGDLDIALDLASKIEDKDARWAAEEQKRGAARRAGRSFQNYVAELSWPREEVLLFLKSRSRTLSLTSFADQPDFFAGIPHQVVYEHPGPARKIP